MSSKDVPRQQDLGAFGSGASSSKDVFIERPKKNAFGAFGSGASSSTDVFPIEPETTAGSSSSTDKFLDNVFDDANDMNAQTSGKRKAESSPAD